MKISEAAQKVQDHYDTKKYTVTTSQDGFQVDCPVAHIKADYVGKTMPDDELDFKEQDPDAIFRLGSYLQLNSMIGSVTQTEGFSVSGTADTPKELDRKLLLTGAYCLAAAIIAVYAGYDVDMSHDITDSMTGGMTFLIKK